MELHNELDDITAELLSDELDYYKLSKAVRSYMNWLLDQLDSNLNGEAGRRDLYMTNGKAIGPFWAAKCIDELMRTKRFVNGTYKAIKDVQAQKEKVHVLYAGTGPFAALLLPLVTLFSADEIKLTLVEVNAMSFEILEKVVKKVIPETYEVVLDLADATKYTIQEADSIDIIVSETMQNGLANEQQVPIFLHLIKQVRKDTIFIPEKIELFIGLKKRGVKPIKLKLSDFHIVDKVFEVSQPALHTYLANKKVHGEHTSFPKRTTQIDQALLNKHDQLTLLTGLQVYQEEIIKFNESGLTVPYVLEYNLRDYKDSIQLTTQYIVDGKPRLSCEIRELQTME